MSSKNAKNVSINDHKLHDLSEWLLKQITKTKYDFCCWKQHELHPKIANNSAIDWIFVVDALNFSFWSENTRYSVTFNGHTYTGYWSLCAAINRAAKNGIPITDPSFYAHLKPDQLEHIFKGENGVHIPLSDQRLQVLHEIGRVLLQFKTATFKH
ncbi:UPF0553 protein C9orf64-like protein [Leptotrombidium deliense]|uniref:Queuosine 5'-phosphate N-glycosylase/hydrolase n=1 Tax=Leptotrombidium deliense TaxID=299467 RepID=A0A443S2G2_9ACAR|nr:UPF0553 protein C9orf64-like protein [Leptotrombidium deliense]